MIWTFIGALWVAAAVWTVYGYSRKERWVFCPCGRACREDLHRRCGDQCMAKKVKV